MFRNLEKLVHSESLVHHFIPLGIFRSSDFITYSFKFSCLYGKRYISIYLYFVTLNYFLIPCYSIWNGLSNYLCIRQLLQLCWLHIYDVNVPFDHSQKVIYWSEIWRLWKPLRYGELQKPVWGDPSFVTLSSRKEPSEDGPLCSWRDGDGQKQ